MKTIKTTDIYLAAYLLQANIPAKDIIKEGHHRRKVMFVYPNAMQVEKHIQKFQSNEAMVKVRDYTYFLERAKDQMHSKMREGGVQ